MECRIQRSKHFVRRCSAGRLLGSVWRHAGKANQVRLMGPGDGVNRVINRGMHERKAAGGVVGGWLRTRRANDRQKYSVPLQDRVERRDVRIPRRMMLVISRCTERLWELRRETRA